MQTEQLFKMDADVVAGVAFDGDVMWASLIRAGKGSLARVDRRTGAIVNTTDTPIISGLAWDGSHLWAVTPEAIQCIDAQTLKPVRSLPRPQVEGFVSGLAWDGEALWAGDYHGRRILKLDRKTGQVLRELSSDRFVTGITWVDDELWHATANDAAAPVGETQAELRRIDAASGAVVESHQLPYVISGLEFDGERFWCGDCNTGSLRTVRQD